MIKRYKDFINEDIDGEKLFLLKDLTGRGYTDEYSLEELPELEEKLKDETVLDDKWDETITDWGEFAEIGDEYIQRTYKITRIK
jgi:hypothetical protein